MQHWYMYCYATFTFGKDSCYIMCSIVYMVKYSANCMQLTIAQVLSFFTVACCAIDDIMELRVRAIINHSPFHI